MMKEQKLNILLKYLKESQFSWVSSVKLAGKMNVSRRTIRNYISELNKQSDIDIQSSAQGYKLVMIDNGEGIREGFNQQQHILCDLLNKNELTSDYFIEKYFISDALLSTNIQNIKVEIKLYGLKIISKDGVIALEGSEPNKRKLMVDMIHNELSPIDNLYQLYPDVNYNLLLDIIREKLQLFEFKINEFVLENICFHYLICINRLKNNEFIMDVKVDDWDIAEGNLNATTEILDELKNHYEFNYNKYEVFQLANLLIGHQKIESNGYVNQEQLFTKKLRETINKSLESISNMTGLVFDSDEFIVRLLFHTDNLIFRLKKNIKNRNPIMSEMKTTYPFIYELAVHVASDIKKSYGYDIPEEEISYIAMHIGMFLLGKENENKKVKILLVCPEYYDIQNKLKKDLEQEFSGKVIIFHYHEIEGMANNNFSYDFIVSTSDNIKFEQYIRIHPFLTNNDKQILKNKIDLVLSEKNTEETVSIIENYIAPNLFKTIPNRESPLLMDKYDVIKEMVNDLVLNNVVGCDFLQDVIKREKLSSTSFGGEVAFPHALKAGAFKTTIAVNIFKKGIMWDKEKVKVIIMIVMNENEDKQFSTIFQNLINLLSDPDIVNQITSIMTYEDFVQLIKENLDGDL